MIKVFSVDNGRVRNCSLDDISKKGTYWIRTIMPSPEEMEMLSKLIKVETAEITEFLTKEERPRMERDKNLHIIFDTPFKEENEVLAIPLSIYVYKNIVVTIEKQALRVLNKLEERLNANKSLSILRYGPGYLAYIILDKINDEFLSYINSIGDMGEVLKNKAKKFDNEGFERIYDYSITLSFFHQSLAANQEVLNALRKAPTKGFSKIDRENFNELYLDSLTIIDSASMERKVIANLFNLQTVLSQQRLNNFMNKITLMALIIMIPTLISSVYGMNISYLPFATNPYSFWIIIALMIVITSIITIVVMNMSKNN